MAEDEDECVLRIRTYDVRSSTSSDDEDEEGNASDRREKEFVNAIAGRYSAVNSGFVSSLVHQTQSNIR